MRLPNGGPPASAACGLVCVACVPPARRAVGAAVHAPDKVLPACTITATDARRSTFLESRSGDIAAIEVKAGASLNARDWRVLARLRDRTTARFRAGVVIHTRQTIPLGDRLWALPISGLWT